MRLIRLLIDIYAVLLSCSMVGFGLVKASKTWFDAVILLVFLVTTSAYLARIGNLMTRAQRRPLMKLELVLLLCGFVGTAMVLIGLGLSMSTVDTTLAILMLSLLPVSLLRRIPELTRQILATKSKAIAESAGEALPHITPGPSQAFSGDQDPALSTDAPDSSEPAGVSEPQKRAFLKLMGGAGIGLLVHLLVNPRQAGAAFFGSVPGPGTVAVKDSSNNKIDPAIKSPTDAYGITEIDDSGSPSYYGFVNKDGAWYITQEDSSGSYRYAKGNSNFSSNWSNRASLSYSYFDDVF